MRMCSGDNVTKYGDGGGHPRSEDRVGLQCLWVQIFFLLFRFRTSQVDDRQCTCRVYYGTVRISSVVCTYIYINNSHRCLVLDDNICNSGTTTAARVIR